MTQELLQKIADVSGLEPFSVFQGIQQTAKIAEQVYCVYMGELTLMASFYLHADAQRYAVDLAARKPMWKIIRVGSNDYVQHITAA
jgi:hypothetical protein